MRLLATVLLVAGTLYAQVVSNRAAGGVVFANPGGYGNVAFPGTGRPSFGHAPSATLPGRAFGQPGGGGAGLRRSHNSSFAYPVIVGGYPGGYEGYSDPSAYAQPQPQITIVNNPAPPPVAPAVVINQYMAPPPDPGSSETTHVFQPSASYPKERAGNDSAPSLHYFLIAYKDHSVYSALAYWVEDKTLHYVTPQQTHNQASVDLIDMDFTKKLNQR